LKIAQERGDKEKETDACIGLGHAYAHSNPVQAAIVYHDIEEYLKKALKIAKELEDKMRETEACLGLGKLYRLKKEFEMAIEHYKIAMQIAKEKGFKEEEDIAANGIEETVNGEFIVV
jgi:tetratricopeptide (TPR) repeat protein